MAIPTAVARNVPKVRLRPKARRCASVQSPFRESKLKPPKGYVAVCEKDCLYTRKWDTDAGPWNVTGEVLDDIVRQYKLYRKNGYVSHFVWNHDEDAKKGIGVDVLDLVRRGNELIAICGAKTAKALSRLEEHDQVSIYVDQHTDGTGRRYTQLLKHIGMVHHPVVNNQRPFKRILSRNSDMAKKLQLRKGRRLAAEGDEGGGGASDEATEMSVKEVVKLINEHFQASIPEDVDTAKELGIALKMLAGGEDPADAVDTEEQAADAMENPLQVAASRGKLTPGEKKLAAERDALKKQLEEQKAKQLSRAKRQFESEAKSLVESGRITAGERAELEKEGKRVGYRLSILAGYKRLAPNAAGTSPKRLASTGASPKPPGERTREEEDKRSEEAAELILGRRLSKNAQPAKSN